MKRLTRVVVPCLAFAALVAACDSNDNDTTGITTTNTANVRFVNAISGTSGNLALTANGSMVGSSQGFGSYTPTCSSVTAGSSALAFGTANSGGTGISSSLGTMSSTFNSGGNYTVIATGTSSNPQLLVLDNTATTTAGTGFANVRFVNATGAPVDFYANTTGSTSLGTATTSGMSAYGFGGYTQIPIAYSQLTFTSNGSTTPLFTSTLNSSFNSGGNYTVVLLPGSGGTGYQTLVLNGTC